MKTRELYSIVLKIIGLITLLQFLTGISVLSISGFGFFMALSSSEGQMNVGYLYASVFAGLLQFLIPLLISIFCLFSTDTILRLLKLDDDSRLEILSERKVLYHLAVLSFGVFLFAIGANGFLSTEYKYETTTKIPQAIENLDNFSQQYITELKKYTVNFISLIESIIGLLLFLKSRKVSEWVLRRIEPEIEPHHVG